MRPEETAIDALAVVHTEGAYNLMPDTAHIVEGGIAKAVIEGLKEACDDATACTHGHGIAKTAALIDDVVKISGGHNTGKVSKGGEYCVTECTSPLPALVCAVHCVIRVFLARQLYWFLSHRQAIIVFRPSTASRTSKCSRL